MNVGNLEAVQKPIPGRQNAEIRRASLTMKGFALFPRFAGGRHVGFPKALVLMPCRQDVRVRTNHLVAHFILDNLMDMDLGLNRSKHSSQNCFPIRQPSFQLSRQDSKQNHVRYL